MLAKDPKGDNITVNVGPSVYAPTLSLSDAPEKAGRPYPCGACLPTPLHMVPADFDYSGPFLMTNSLFLSYTSDSHDSLSYMGDKHDFSLLFENTFRRTERIKKFLKSATQRTTISVTNSQL